jgi:hypothetical protein
LLILWSLLLLLIGLVLRSLLLIRLVLWGFLLRLVLRGLWLGGSEESREET